MMYLIYILSVLLEEILAMEFIVIIKQRKESDKSTWLFFLITVIVLFLCAIITSKLYYNHLLGKTGYSLNIFMLIPTLALIFIDINEKIKKIFYSKVTIISLFIPVSIMLTGLLYAIICF